MLGIDWPDPHTVNAMSNHPPPILRNIPDMIARRVSSISVDSGVFADATYRNALAASGLSANIKYIDPTPPAAMNGSKEKRKRKRNVVWFNPPYSKSVRTNIAGTFLRLIDKHFPKGSKMNKIFNHLQREGELLLFTEYGPHYQWPQ